MLTDVTSARTVIALYPTSPEWAALPEDLRTRYIAASVQPSVVNAVVDIAELLYANRAAIGEGGRALSGDLAAYAASHGWHGLEVDDRGARIALAMRREDGEEGDPAPIERFVIVEPAEAPAV